MAVEWMVLGLAGARLLARTASLLHDFDWNTVADTSDDVVSIWSTLRRWGAGTAETERVGRVLAETLREKHAAYVGSHFHEAASDADLQPLIPLAAGVIGRLTPQGNLDNIDLLLSALVEPDTFTQYVRDRGGDLARREVPRDLEPAWDYLLAAASTELCRLARSSPAALREAAAELLRGQRQIGERLGDIHELLIGTPNGPVPTDKLRLATERAREATRPENMPAVDRRKEFGITDSGAVPTPLVILGEGGAGKSVVAGDLVDWSADYCILVPCSRVPANADLSTVAAIDLALGDAALDSRSGFALTSILDSLTAETLVVIDTIDLLLTDRTADNLVHLIRHIQQRSPLVVTSREQEWHDLLGTDALPEHRLGLLNQEQIAAWVDAYLTKSDIESSESQASFRRSVASVIKSSQGRILLGSPVRLAMSCSLYAAQGDIPPELSVPQLYLEYWSANVVHDRRGRRNTPEARGQNECAIAVAQKIWRASTSIFVEYISYTGLSVDAVQDLLSSGLLKTNGSELLGFFHQTFAEFAVARYLASDSSQEDLESLGRALVANSPAHWGVARYLAWVEMDRSFAVRLADVLPRNDEGVRVLLRTLSMHDSSEALETELNTLEKTDTDTLRRAFPVLADAVPTCCLVVYNSGLRLLGGEGSDLTAIVRTMAPVLTRLPHEFRSRLLAQTCQALIARGSDVALTDLFRLLETLMLGPAASEFDFDVLIPLYRNAGAAAQRVILDWLSDAPREMIANFLEVALTAPCPADAVEEAVEIAHHVWEVDGARIRMGWQDWKSMLEHDYPPRWEAVQVRLAGRLCYEDDVRQGLVGTLLQPEASINRKRYTNAISFAARTHPNLVAESLLCGTSKVTRAIAGNMCTVISFLGEDLSQANADALWVKCLEVLRLDPRRILTAMVTLGSVATGRLDELLDLLLADRLQRDPLIPQPAVDSCWDALFTAFAESDYQRNHARMAALVDGNRIEDRRRRVRMFGRDALLDEEAWAELRLTVFDKGLEGLAKIGVKELLRQFRTLSSTTRPLVEFVGTPHASCARAIAETFAEHLPTDWDRDDIRLIVERLSQSILNREDSQVTGALLGLLAKIAHQKYEHAPVGADETRTVLEALRVGITDAQTPSVQSAYLDHWLTTMSRIGVFRFTSEEVGRSLNEVLTQVDTGRLGNNATRRLATSLVGITNNAVGAWRILGATWRTQPIANQTAIAEALVHGTIPGGGEIAAARARESTCPPELSQRIHQLIGT